jgi:hypothetical protein
MTYMIRQSGAGQAEALTFEGTLDRAALAELIACCAAALRRGLRVHVRLRAGTEVEAEALGELVRLEGVSLSAEDPFLTRWINSTTNRRRTR